MTIEIPNTQVQVHHPEEDSREPKTRPKMFFFDRIKVFVIIAIMMALFTAHQKSQVLSSTPSRCMGSPLWLRRRS